MHQRDGNQTPLLSRTLPPRTVGKGTGRLALQPATVSLCDMLRYPPRLGRPGQAQARRALHRNPPHVPRLSVVRPVHERVVAPQHEVSGNHGPWGMFANLIVYYCGPGALHYRVPAACLTAQRLPRSCRRPANLQRPVCVIQQVVPADDRGKTRHFGSGLATPKLRARQQPRGRAGAGLHVLHNAGWAVASTLCVSTTHRILYLVHSLLVVAVHTSMISPPHPSEARRICAGHAARARASAGCRRW